MKCSTTIMAKKTREKSIVTTPVIERAGDITSVEMGGRKVAKTIRNLTDEGTRLRATGQIQSLEVVVKVIRTIRMTIRIHVHPLSSEPRVISGKETRSIELVVAFNVNNKRFISQGKQVGFKLLISWR